MKLVASLPYKHLIPSCFKTQFRLALVLGRGKKSPHWLQKRIKAPIYIYIYRTCRKKKKILRFKRSFGVVFSFDFLEIFSREVFRVFFSFDSREFWRGF